MSSWVELRRYKRAFRIAEFFCHCLSVTLSKCSKYALKDICLVISYVRCRIRLRSIVVCSDSSEDYWFALYKKEAEEDAETYWLDGETSNYRWWHKNEPNENHMCFRYTSAGFRDRSCTKQYPFTCKMTAAGKHRARCRPSCCLSFTQYAYRLWDKLFERCQAEPQLLRLFAFYRRQIASCGISSS